MKLTKSSQALVQDKNKEARRLRIQNQFQRQLSPLAHFINYNSSSTHNSKQKRKAVFLRSTRYTSPNSYQSSQIVSKKQSRQKNGFKRNKDNQGQLNIKKKKKTRANQSNLRDNEKQNCSKELNKAISQRFKITKWKNKILKQFVVKSYESNQEHNSLNYLQKSLALFNQQMSKSKPSNSFFGYFLGQSLEQGKKTALLGAQRILTIDWMYLLSTSLLLNRQTVHLAVHYLDSFFLNKEEVKQNVPIFAAAALFLSVKQEERQLQSTLLQTVCMSQKFQVVREQVIQSQKAILRKLNFRLKSNTLPFWIDYFSLKWDSYLQSIEGQQTLKQANFNKVKLRSSDGDCYRLYRELMELADVCLMFGDYLVFQKCKLSLACIYLVVRIESQKAQLKYQNQDEDLFKTYHKLFMKKASPIFKDPYRMNEIFNQFLTQICSFEITQIIPCIKYIANFLQLDFSYNIDEKALQETKSYEDFIRRMTYSYEMKDYCLLKIS